VLTLIGLAMLLVPPAFAQSDMTDNNAPVGVLSPCPTGACPAMPPTLITGVLGSCGNWPNCTSALQTGRLNRNGVSSECDVPKTCDLFTTDPGRPVDAYTITNSSGADACVTAELTVLDQTGCNLQILFYLNTYDPLNICEPQSDYLADAGVSSGIPPAPTSMCGIVPNGDDLIVVVHEITPGSGVGCNYEIRLMGDCIPVELQSMSVE